MMVAYLATAAAPTIHGLMAGRDEVLEAALHQGTEAVMAVMDVV